MLPFVGKEGEFSEKGLTFGYEEIGVFEIDEGAEIERDGGGEVGFGLCA